MQHARPTHRRARMAKVKIPYFIERPGAHGPRYFWQPSSELRRAGFRSERLPEDRRAALARAQELNDGLDRWRRGEAPIAGTGAPAGEVQRGSLAHVIRLYKASRHWLGLADKTRRGYLQNIAVLEEWGGAAPVAAIGPKRIETLYARLAKKTPAKAKAVATMLGILMQHAVREELLTVNPARSMGLKGAEPSGMIWPRAAVAAFVQEADQLGWHSVGTAVAINHWLGQRQGDILALPRAAYRDGRFVVAQSKGEKRRVRVSIPESEAVKVRVAEELARQATANLAGTTLLLCEGNGLPWKGDYFRQVFAQIRASLAKRQPSFALSDGEPVATGKLQFMHLRHTAITEHAIAGATSEQISGFTGQSIKTIEQLLDRHYLVKTAALADAAAAHRIAADKPKEQAK